MNRKARTALKWTAAFLITLSLSVFQRMTGPTYPVRGSETIGGITVSYRLLRSHETGRDLPVTLETEPQSPPVFLEYRRLNSTDRWAENTTPLQEVSPGIWRGKIPAQPVAGKVKYRLFLQSSDERLYINDGKSVVARFKGPVPGYFLIPHVLLMFLSILLTVRLGLELLSREGHYDKLVNITLPVFFAGAGILGPIVQYHAFGDAWTGFPLGTDLTDNKALIALFFWILAVLFKKRNRIWVVLAVVVMLLIYLVPHSVLGSELDYRTGTMKNKYTRAVHPPPAAPGPTLRA